MRLSSRSSYSGFAPYVPVAVRQAKAAREIAALRKKGRDIRPVVLAGRTIASTFWGKAWCTHLESYSDYANRLPRGRAYVRNGSVVDLQLAPGEVTALVQGSSMYTVRITIAPVERARWDRIVSACSGGIASIVELLQGRLSDAVMAILTARDTGLFPQPRQIKLACSCPDRATMCKHVAATLYGVGARLDREPELLFRLRGADPTALVATVAKGAVVKGRAVVAKERILEDADLGSVFGIELDDAPSSTGPAPSAKRATQGKVVASKRSKRPAAPEKAAASAKRTSPSASKAPAKRARKAPSKPETAKARTLRGAHLATAVDRAARKR